MIVPNVFDTDDGDLGPVDFAVRAGRTRFVIGNKHYTPAAREAERELPSAITFERVGVAGDEVCDTSSCFKIAKTCAQLVRAHRPQLPLGDDLLLT
jgi:hypothetical protein